MAWTPHEVGQLLKLAESGALAPDELQRAGRLGALEPVPDAWFRAADRLFAVAGSLLLAAAVVFFFAWNWADLHRFAKLGIALAALAACTGAAFFSRPYAVPWRASLLGAAVVTGAVLALVGQTYQTGADVWELFAAWSVLMLPFVLLARSTAGWLLWLAVANAALLRYLSELQAGWFTFLSALTGPDYLLVIAAMNALLLLAFESWGARLLEIPRRHVQAVAAIGVLGPLGFGACIGWWEREFLTVGLVAVAVAGAMGWVYFQLRRDLLILAFVLFGGIAIATSLLARAMPDGAAFIAMNLVSLFVIGSSAAAAIWIARLHRLGRAQ